MIFNSNEAEQWAVEHLYPEAGIEPAAVDMEKLYRAEELMAGIDGNARFMLSEGRSDEEVKQYVAKYAMQPDEYAQKSVEFLKDPFHEAYIFTYFYGRQLMKPLLEESDKQTVFKRFLTEQLCPSDLVRA